MELSTTQKATGCAATQNHSTIFWNLKINDCIHKSSPLFPILSQANPAHTTSFCLFKIQLNIIHPLTSWSS
jgi:hypothetical protein